MGRQDSLEVSGNDGVDAKNRQNLGSAGRFEQICSVAGFSLSFRDIARQYMILARILEQLRASKHYKSPIAPM